MNELLIDVSRWQGRFTPDTAKSLRSAGILGAWVKLTQGATHKDPVGLDNAKVLQAGGLKVGGYHFANLDNALDQAKNFLASLEKISWDLPPFIDAEAFVQTGAEAYQPAVPLEYSVRDLYAVPGLASSLADTTITFDENEFSAVEWIDTKGNIRKLTVYATYAAQLPRYQDIDVIANRVKNWMATQPKIERFLYPAIYTNPSYGNQIFVKGKADSMAKYPLIIAHWGVTADKIIMPAIWKGRKYLSWQYGVDQDGSSIGINGPVDRQRWGDLFPFPATPQPEPEPEPGQRSIYLVQKEEDGSTWAGTLYEVTQ